MLPSAFVTLAALPTTPHGTIDRAALPEVELPEPAQDTPFVAPADDLQRSIAQVWRDLLGVERVGGNDNFFALGGHSLLATKLAAQIKATQGVQVPLRVFFEHPTVAEFAAWIVEQRLLAPSGVSAIPVASRGEGIALSFAQERLLLRHPVAAEDPYHNVLTAVTLTGHLDEDALRRGLDDIVRRHEALRTRIVPGSPELVQVIDLTGTWPLAVVSLLTDDEPTRSRKLRGLIGEESDRPFRTGEGPMVRGTLIATLPDEHVLILVMHHLVTDNWSYGVLLRDLRECYEAHTLGRKPALPDLEIQYPDYAAWQRHQLISGALDEQIGFWRDQLRDLPPALSFDAPAHQISGRATGHTRAFAIDAATTKALDRLGQREGATLFMVLMAAFDLLLHTYSDADDIVVTFPVAGRDRPETADLIGYFVNHLVVRSDLSGDRTFLDLLDQVRERTLAAYDHQGVPLWTAGTAVDRDREPFRILFNLLNAPLPEQDLYGLRTAPLNMGIGSDYVFAEVVTDMTSAEVDLALIMREDAGGLKGMWLYSIERLDAQVMSVLMRQWGRVIELILADPEQGVGKLRDALRQAARPDTDSTTRKGD